MEAPVLLSDASCFYCDDKLIVTPAIAFAVQDADIISADFSLSGVLAVLFLAVQLICSVGFVVWIMLIGIIIKLLLSVRL